jgi:ATP synthase F1 epsilon subunit
MSAAASAAGQHGIQRLRQPHTEPIAMAMTVHVDIVSAEGEIHSGLAAMVYAPGEMGELGIAPRHSPLITRLKPGDVRVETDNGMMEHFYVSGGMLEVQPDVVTVLADEVDAPKTGLLAAQLKNLGLSSALIVVEKYDDPLFLAARNIPDVEVVTVPQVNPVSLVAFEHVLVTEAALRNLEERRQ